MFSLFPPKAASSAFLLKTRFSLSRMSRTMSAWRRRLLALAIMIILLVSSMVALSLVYKNIYRIAHRLISPRAYAAAPVIALSFNEGSGTTTADASGNNNNGTLVGGVTWTTAGKYGNALSFDGASGVLRIPNSPSWKVDGLTGYTVSMWIKVKSADGDYLAALGKGEWPSADIVIYKYGSQWQFGIRTTDLSCGGITSAIPYLSTVDNTYHHIALSMDASASQCNFYSDGQVVGTDEYVSGTTVFATGDGLNDLIIGGLDGGHYLNADIDEMRVYTTALTQAEIQNDMNTPIGGGSGDTMPPVISSVSAGNITTTGATITWTTNENSDSQVEYGTSTGYGQTTTLSTSLVTAHSQGLSGLSPGIEYHYRVKSRDGAGNLAISDDFSFTTGGGGATPIIVALKLPFPFTPEGELSSDEIQAQRAAISQAQTNLLNSLSTVDYDSASVKIYKYVPQLALRVDATAMSQLQSSQLVSNIHNDTMAHVATETETLALIGAPAAWNTYGYTGEGQTIVVADTGVYKTHSDLTGKVVSEACYSTNMSGAATTITSLCPNQVSSSTAADSGVNCTANSDCNHGTQVAGIAAGASGVAPGANLISIQIYSLVNSASVCGSTNPCLMSTMSDQIRALNYVFSLKDIYHIAAVNLSLSNGRSANCDATNQLKPIIDQLRSVGIATITASGNDSYSDALGSPACISSTISVGATENGRAGTVDTIWPQSNSSSLLNLLAPGDLINALVPGSGYADASGTSLAAAHVSGAWAILKQQQPDATVSQILNRLKNNGVNITDTRNNLTRSRIKIDAALSCLQNVPITNWRGEYFDNTDLSGNPIMARDDTGSLNFLDKEFSDGTLASSCSPGANNISIRWTRTVNLVAAQYAFTVEVDQDARLFVDGTELSNGWETISGAKTYPTQSLSSGSHTLMLDYRTTVGATRAKLSWSVPPAAPSGLAAIPSTTSPQITLNWNENDANASGFKIERSTDGGNSYPWNVTLGGGSGALSYTDTTVAYGVTYIYRVTAYNIAGSNSAISNAATTIPAAPSNFVAVCPDSPSQINLSWTNNSNADGIIIERANGGGYVQIVTVGANVTTYSDTGLNPATTYTYRVRAYNGTGSSYSNESTASTSCSYTVNPTYESFDSIGGGDIIQVSTQEGCSWSTTTNVDWIVIEIGSGTGNGGVIFSVDSYEENYGMRFGTMYIHGYGVGIMQRGPTCGSPCTDKPNKKPDQAATNAGLGALTAGYLSNPKLIDQPTFKRIDPVINFNWADKYPDNLIPEHEFGARWVGWVASQPTFQPQNKSAPVELIADTKADIRPKYFNRGGETVIQSLWNSASTFKQIITKKYLYPEASTNRSTTTDANKQTANNQECCCRQDWAPVQMAHCHSRMLEVECRQDRLAAEGGLIDRFDRLWRITSPAHDQTQRVKKNK